MKNNQLENEYLIKDDFAILIVKSKTYGVFESLIDIEDIPKIENYHWHIRYDRRHPKHYIETRQNKKRIHLHRFLLDLKDFNLNNTVDHINGNSLDNRKSNLRICSLKENLQNVKISSRNKAGVKYITWCNTLNLWKVVYKTKYVGCSKNLEKAKEILKNYINSLNIVKSHALSCS